MDRVSIPRCCFDEVGEAGADEIACYQLHGFCDASNVAIAAVVYLRRVIGNRPSVAFIIGKSKLVLTHQENWVISRKELEAAKLCAELVMEVSKILKCLSCSFHFWTDSQVVLKWIMNPDLHLPRFVKRRVDKIHLMNSTDNWDYVNNAHNPADVGTPDNKAKKSDCLALWLKGPKFLC